MTYKNVLMKLKDSFIQLRGLRFHAYHGVAAQERLVGNDYVVDLRLHVNVDKAMRSDNVDDTVNYAEVFQAVREQMAHPSDLVEHVAGRIAQAVLDRWPQVADVTVSVTKLNPPMGADCQGAGVELHVSQTKNA